jgi:hypothetical protein
MSVTRVSLQIGPPKFHREVTMLGNGTQRQRKLSSRTVDDTLRELQGQYNVSGLNHGFTPTATELNVSFQQSASRTHPIMYGMSSLNLQSGMSQSQPQYRGSPDPSLSDRFARNFDISDQSHIYSTSNEVGEEAVRPTIGQNQSEPFVTTHTLNTPAAFDVNWDPQDQLLNTLQESKLGNSGTAHPTATNFGPLVAFIVILKTVFSSAVPFNVKSLRLRLQGQ